VALSKPNTALNVAAYTPTMLNLACYVMFIACFVFYYTYCPALQMLYGVIIVLCSILSK